MHIVIIGNGVAGATCALAARQWDESCRITMIGEETPYFFSRTALMYALMHDMPRHRLEPYEREVWSKQRIALIHGRVIDIDNNKKQLTLSDRSPLAYDRLVIATGSVANRIPWPGLDEVSDDVFHFISMQDLDKLEARIPSMQQAVVVGGGLIGIELVECLRYHDIPTTFLVREPWYWPAALAPEEGEMVSEVIRSHGVDLRLSDEIESVESSGEKLTGIRTRAGEELTCDALAVCAGVRPNTSLVERATTPPELRRGVLVDRSFATSLDGVFAIGDCAEIVAEEGESTVIEPIWYAARRHALQVVPALFDRPVDYRAPVFFNSSKFFDIEYTTVGEVVSRENPPETLYLRHPKRKASVRLAHRNGRVIGFNMLGSRWNHELLMRWINEGRSLDWTLQHLGEAQFDVEFGRLDLKQLQPAWP